ncbi:glycosyltransferase [Limosilactobacillus reuteri]|uniref:glycosyltransferase n=1 Tax=Limosilactobacillus reuteri TaxID=1598 RepID=UPI001E2928C3|nr:glycosyltransferase [Limosilactobacillus reuteri]MCC4412599.1 glycosyltransferase [Limosilactobacillus reuteri]
MIFVTVGTHEQQFNRLIREVDNLVKNNIIKEPVMMQTGFSTYKPKYCPYKPMLSFNQMNTYISKAHIVITHGGPSSFIEVLQTGKVPIVVPRLKKYGEHINDHQVNFVKLIQKKKNNIIPVYDIDELKSIIKDYDQRINETAMIKSNNKVFNERFSEIISDLIKH